MGKIRSSEVVQEAITTAKIDAMDHYNKYLACSRCAAYLVYMHTCHNSINNNGDSSYFLSFSLLIHTLINTFGMLFWQPKYSLLGILSSYIISIILNFSINTINEPYLMPQRKWEHRRVFIQSLSKLFLLELVSSLVKQPKVNTKLQVNVEKLEAKWCEKIAKVQN